MMAQHHQVSRVLMACLAAATCAMAAEGGVSLSADSPWVMALANESTGFAMAARDVQLDAYRALGAPPVVLTAVPSASATSAGTSVLVAGSPGGNSAVAAMVAAGLVPENCTTTWEAHCVVPVPASRSPFGLDTVVATGAGKRGPIYALYELAHRGLGADPY